MGWFADQGIADSGTVTGLPPDFAPTGGYGYGMGAVDADPYGTGATDPSTGQSTGVEAPGAWSTPGVTDTSANGTGAPAEAPGSGLGAISGASATTQPYADWASWNPTLAQIGTPASFSYNGTGASAQTVNPTTPVTAPTVTPQTIQGSSITAPGALTATNAIGFTGLTPEQLASDQSYQFRLKQGLGATAATRAAQGIYRGGGTLQALNDYAGSSASQEYAAANARALQESQNNAAVVGQNNAAAANAYGLTNQFGQAAQIANQGNALTVAQANVANGLQAGEFNTNAGLAANAQQFGQNLSSTTANNAATLAATNANYSNAANAYGLNTNASTSLGQLGLAQSSLGLGAQNQAFTQANTLNNQNWNQNYQLAQLGQPAK